ncbi:hypothetical protein [Legionella maioricensis]|uniref:At1g61320/AtMIF1 LRR domain-containing protein n=1 Tax=Legionella maioricensis TaxID=2896528 RepID=A0A9X2CXE8_9GAMM|nr:hypothetical protein [Legionella maioricensis]MCL9682529.1 hypothetical protein [Legionella maioricensis]MCL9686224.1 hypothetical protein [Legionella maioricensis]
MPYPADFYYTESSGEPLFSATPQGSLDVNQLVKSKPYWKKYSSQSKKPKSLIVADWTIYNSSKVRIDEIKAKLNQLMIDGFSIYIWQNGIVEKLSKTSIDRLSNNDVQQKMAPAFPGKVIDCAIRQHPNLLSISNTCILDDHAMECLLSGVDSLPRGINLDRLCSNRSDAVRNKIYSILQQATPPVEEIISSNFSSDDGFESNSAPKMPVQKELEVNFPLAKPGRKYRELTLKKDEVQTLLEKKVVTTANETFEWPQLREIKELKIDSPGSFLTPEKLQEVFLEIKELKSVTLRYLEHDLDSEISFNLPQLEYVDIAATPPLLVSRLLSSPKLKAITFAGNRQVQTLEPRSFSFPCLEYVLLYNSSISGSDLSRLLADTPNLKILYLHQCSDLANFDVGRLNNLDELKIVSTDVSLPTLYKIFLNAPNLKNLDLSGILLKNLDGSKLSLSALETLRFAPSAIISPTDLQQLLSATPNLKTLDLNYASTLDSLGFSGCNLRSLETLNLNGSNISGVNLKQLLINAPNLQQLDLNFCRNLNDLEVLDINLLKLNELSLSFSTISGVNLHKLLRRSPNLQTLDLVKCNLSSFDAQDLNLASLTKLNLHGVTIPTPHLERFLAGTPNLKTIHLNGVTFSDFRKDCFYLPSLEEAFLSSATISIANLQQFLMSTPNIKTLTLNEVELGDFKSTMVPLNHLEKLSLACSEISSETLYQLLLSAPNLKEVHLTDCQNVSPKILELLHSRNVLVLDGIKTPELGPESNKNETLILKDPTHNRSSFFHQKPTSQDFEFRFKGTNKSLNQGMVIEKLSQYLHLTNQHRERIFELQDGICSSLVHLFLSKNKDEWNSLMGRVNAWNGHLDTLNRDKLLHNDFREILDYVEEYQFKFCSAPKQYLGDALDEFLMQHAQGSFFFNNPWHVIGVKSLGRGTWEIYDPNGVEGPKTVSSRDELKALIKKSLGELVSVQGSYTIKTPCITNSNVFLQEGGLLALIDSSQADLLLQNLPPASHYSFDALEGLLIRNTEGKPAWALAIKTPHVANYTLSLLQEFSKKNKNFIAQLHQSMDALSSFERHACIEALSTLTSSYSQLPSFVADVTVQLRAREASDYSRQLETWNRDKPPKVSLSEYCQNLVAVDEHKKRLVELNSAGEVKALQLAVLNHCLSVSRPVYCINSPDDLVCSAPFIRREGEKGILQKGPGGPFYDFLMKPVDVANPPVVLVNYDAFNADDIVRYNSLLDQERLADGTPLSAHVQVIGFINPNKPGCYQGADFYSRLDKREKCPLSEEALMNRLPQFPKEVVLGELAEESTVINLGAAGDWEERLLGRWRIKKDVLEFEEGALEKALALGKPIQIQNGLWGRARFQEMWHEMMIRGEIHHAGRIIKIPPSQQWSRTQGYEWSKLTPHVAFTSGLKVDSLLLNPKQLSTYFRQYQCSNEEAALDTLPGVLEQCSGSTLDVNLTRSLTEDEWGLLLNECIRHEVKLQCHVAPGVSLPPSLVDESVLTKPIRKPWDKSVQGNPLIMTSSDSLATVRMLTKHDKECQIIDVSECEAAGLLMNLNGRLNPNTLRFEFQQKISAVLAGLADHKKVVLHGHFSAELMDDFASLLLSSKKLDGQLVLVGDESTTSFNYCSNVQHHDVTLEEKLSLLKTRFKATATELQLLTPYYEESYSRLVARITYSRAFPNEVGRNPWQGMEDLPRTFRPSAFDAANSKAKADAFIQKRLNEVNAVLAHSPYVYLTGPTAVGKSTFISEHFAAQPNITLYQSESRMRDWALDDSANEAILFIDEANITPNKWSNFEGLFDVPPGIVIEGTYYPLTARHKVVFAGNPLSYGGERQLSPFFTQHGNAVVFEPMPLEFIYEKLLKPVFVGTRLEHDTLKIVTPILDIYRFMGQYSHDAIRELQMMALFVVSYAHQHPKASTQDCILASRHYAYQLARTLVAESHRSELDAQFKPQQSLPQSPLVVSPDFLITPSRDAAARRLHDLLDLRDLRRTTLNETQKYGGVGGIILEGDPASGKSEMVISSLIARGYVQIHDYEGEPNLNGPNKAFYRMPVSMQIADKKKLLLKAFHEGAVVVVDEINSAPMMERLLNDLLMGKTPEGAPPLKPGFLIIGTQNSVNMAGRRLTGTALAHRLIHLSLPPCPHAENKAILIAKGVKERDAELLVRAFETNLAKARLEHLTPEPTFRDVLRVARNVINSYSTSIEEKDQILKEPIQDPSLQIQDPSLQQKELIQLYEQIEKLFSYGTMLVEKNEVKSIAEGTKAQNLANELKAIAGLFTSDGIGLEDQETCRNLFRSALNDGYTKMGTHREIWKPILINIAIAATLVGLFLVLGKLAVTGSGFFSQTERQKTVKEIQKSFDDWEVVALNQHEVSSSLKP